MVMHSCGWQNVRPAWRAARQTISSPSVSTLVQRSRTYASTPTTETITSSTKQVQRQDTFAFFSPRRPEKETKSKRKLVQALKKELYNPQTSPDRAWKSYLAFKEASSTSSDDSLLHLQPSHFTRLLHLICPNADQEAKMSKYSVIRRKSMRELDAAAATGTTPEKVLFVPLHNTIVSRSSSESVRIYVGRAQAIFRDMEHYSDKLQQSAMPTLSHYNQVLGRLASGGHLGPMSMLWDKLTLPSTRKLKPDQETYRALMVGLFRHADRQIMRVQVSEATRQYRLSGRHRNAVISARRAAGDMALDGHVLAPNARAAAMLAGLRSVILLKEMRNHGVVPNQETLDFALRSFRLAGHLEGVLLLLKQAYGINLMSPDSRANVEEAYTSSKPTVHTLNTLLMTFGEQATVPEMIAAYEVLSKPLPTSDNTMNAALDGGMFFTTSWVDQESSPSESVISASNQASSPIPAVFPYSTSNRIPANSKTFDILIKHCSKEVDPLRAPVPLAVNGTISTKNALSDLQNREEMLLRKRGHYRLFARALIMEALELSEDLLQQTARALGIDVFATQQDTKTSDTQVQPEVVEPRAGQTRFGPESTQDRPEYLAFDAVPGSALEPDFFPVLVSIQFSITSVMLLPFYSNASQRQHIPDLLWLQEPISKALALTSARIKVLDTALRTYTSRFDETFPFANPKLEQTSTHSESLSHVEARSQEEETRPSPSKLESQQISEVRQFLQTIADQRRIAVRHAKGLESLLYDTLYPRLHTLYSRRRSVSQTTSPSDQLEQEREELERLEQQKQQMTNDRQKRLALEREAKEKRSLAEKQAAELELGESVAIPRW